MKYHLFAAAIVVASPALAERIYSDDFNAEAGGGTAVFQESLTNWDVDGYVDVIGTDNTLGYTVGSTVIDLGGGLTGGFITSKDKFSYDAGKLVTVSWDMSGNQIRPRGEDAPYIQFIFDQTHPERFQEVEYIRGTEFFSFVDFPFGDWEGPIRIFDEFFALGYGLYGDYANTRQTISFVPLLAGSFRFQFGTFTGGGYGPLIDNFAVDVTNVPAAIPEPASWAMMIAGFALAGAGIRRRSPLRAVNC